MASMGTYTYCCIHKYLLITKNLVINGNTDGKTLMAFNYGLVIFFSPFQFDGEIKVLYSTTTVQELSQKRWGYKDLQIKPGESLDVIESTNDTKVLCRNEEGKCKFC